MSAFDEFPDLTRPPQRNPFKVPADCTYDAATNTLVVRCQPKHWYFFGWLLLGWGIATWLVVGFASGTSGQKVGLAASTVAVFWLAARAFGVRVVVRPDRIAVHNWFRGHKASVTEIEAIDLRWQSQGESGPEYVACVVRHDGPPIWMTALNCGSVKRDPIPARLAMYELVKMVLGVPGKIEDPLND